MRQRTEPSLFKVPSQFLRPLERLKLDKQERTAKVLLKSRPSAKPTMPKVDLVPNKDASQPQSALQALVQVTVVQVHPEAQAVALVLPNHEQSERSYYETHN